MINIFRGQCTLYKTCCYISFIPYFRFSETSYATHFTQILIVLDILYKAMKQFINLVVLTRQKWKSLQISYHYYQFKEWRGDEKLGKFYNQRSWQGDGHVHSVHTPNLCLQITMGVLLLCLHCTLRCTAPDVCQCPAPHICSSPPPPRQSARGRCGPPSTHQSWRGVYLLWTPWQLIGFSVTTCSLHCSLYGRKITRWLLN